MRVSNSTVEYSAGIKTDLRLLPGVAGNLKSFMTDGDAVESEWSSFLGSSDWVALRGPETLFLSGGSGGTGGSEASTVGLFSTVVFDTVD